MARRPESLNATLAAMLSVSASLMAGRRGGCQSHGRPRSRSHSRSTGPAAIASNPASFMAIAEGGPGRLRRRLVLMQLAGGGIPHLHLAPMRDRHDRGPIRRVADRRRRLPLRGQEADDRRRRHRPHQHGPRPLRRLAVRGDIRRDPMRLHRQQQRLVDPIHRQQRLGLAGQLPGLGLLRVRGGALRVAVGLGALADRQARRRQRHHHQHHERGHRTPSQPSCPAVLPDVLTLELVLGHPVHRGRQIRHRRPEAAVAKIQIRLVMREPQVQMARLLGDRRHQPLGNRVAHQPTRLGIPLPDTRRQRRQDPISRLGRQPVLDLLVHPRRRRRLRRRQQHEPLRLIQRRLDRRPQMRVRGQPRLVPEHPQRACLVPRLRQLLQPRLQRRRQPTIRRVAIGDERVVRHPAPLRRRELEGPAAPDPIAQCAARARRRPVTHPNDAPALPPHRSA